MVLPTYHHPWLRRRAIALCTPATGLWGSGTLWSPERLGPSVAVGHAHDVVLAEIRARLHLDELQRQLAGVFEPVFGPDRDVDGLVFANEHALRVPLHDRRALHDDPV